MFGELKETIINLDKITYAAQLDNLSKIKNHTSYEYCFEIGDKTLINNILEEKI